MVVYDFVYGYRNLYKTKNNTRIPNIGLVCGLTNQTTLTIEWLSLSARTVISLYFSCKFGGNRFGSFLPSAAYSQSDTRTDGHPVDPKMVICFLNLIILFEH